MATSKSKSRNARKARVAKPAAKVARKRAPKAAPSPLTFGEEAGHAVVAAVVACDIGVLNGGLAAYDDREFLRGAARQRRSEIAAIIRARRGA